MRTLKTLLLAGVLSGCASTDHSSQGLSDDWRIQQMIRQELYQACIRNAVMGNGNMGLCSQ